jgi:hypothetical protein
LKVKKSLSKLEKEIADRRKREEETIKKVLKRIKKEQANKVLK